MNKTESAPALTELSIEVKEKIYSIQRNQKKGIHLGQASSPWAELEEVQNTKEHEHWQCKLRIKKEYGLVEELKEDEWEISLNTEQRQIMKKLIHIRKLGFILKKNGKLLNSIFLSMQKKMKPKIAFIF